MANNITLNISEVTNNGVPCKDPIILVIGHEGEMAFPCTEKVDKDGNLKISLPDNVFTNKCVKIAVQCSNCDKCGEEERTICLCETSSDCSQCSDCNSGICVDRCLPTEICNGSTCCECNSDTPCPQGFFCDGCKCQCAGIVNSRGECVECEKNSDCSSNCQYCNNGSCVDKTCPNNLICMGDNGECGCPAGTQYDITTNSCIAIECTKDSDCNSCEVCLGNNCAPLVCPEDYICQGNECIYWPCTNTTCNSGADCGENCGCLDGQCTPCYLLECTGECAEALGCKCNTNTDKCEPVDNCGDYCDGSTPCLSNNCTCYNNTCVSCENFPCTEGDGGCDSYYNCGCTGGDCAGGKGCADKLELTKIENCPTECALEATFTTESSCFCDPIEFRVKNIKTCNLSDLRNFGAIMNLEVKAYKNGRPYESYLSEVTIGDDELLNATIKTQISFFTKNAGGAWVPETVNAVQVPEVSALGNIFDLIAITNGNVGFNTQGVIQANRKAEITLTAVGVKIPENDCEAYGDKVIANYTLDFTDAFITCNQVESYKAEQKTILTDNDSIRRPLFIWSKSNTGTFSPDKYNPSTNYNSSGWFRKEYGQKVGNTWTDKIAGISDGLWNNLNYKVTVDCGCKSNTTSLEKVVFCCPKDFEYDITNCGRKITVKAFNTCDVNRKISSTIPAEVQTYYYLVLNGVDYLLRTEGGNLLSDFVLEIAEPINTVTFEQRYVGSAIVPKACAVDYVETPDVPDFDVEVECGKVVVKKRSGTPTISNVSFVGAPFSAAFVPTNTNTVWTATIPKESYTLKVSTQFTGSCVFTKEIQVTCQPEIEATPTKIVAQGECPNGTNPDVLVKAISGFSSAAEFLNPKDNTWSTGTVVSGVLQKNFTNFAAGTYIFKVREGSKIAEATVTIDPTVKPIVSVKDICGSTTGEIKLSAGKAGSTWRITGPAFTGGTTVQLNQAGESTTSIPADKQGEYFITLVADTTGYTCPQVLTATVDKDGGNLTPSITTSLTTVCQGGEVQFKIVDGGNNLTYNVTVNGGLLQDLNGSPINTVVANTNGGYNAKVKVTTSGVVNINVVSISGNTGCYTITPATVSVTATAGPSIIESFAYCGDTVNTFTGYVVVSGTATTVTIGGTNATPDGVGGWWVYNVPYTEFETSTPGIATNGSCTDSVQITLPDCTAGNFCPQPPQVVNIITNPQSPTCGIENVSVLFNGSSLGTLDGEQYAWYEVIGNTDVLMTSGTVDPLTALPNVQGVPNLVVSSSNQEKLYKLRITTQGVCQFDSEVVPIVAGSSINPTIQGPTTGILTTGSYNYFVQDIPGATYEWTLSNVNGSNQPIGNTANVTISSFAQGTNTINVTVVSGACSGTSSLTVTVGLNCPQQIVIQPTVGTGSSSCKDLTFVINNNTSAILSHTWKVDNVTVQSGGASILNLDTDIVEAGDVVDVILEVEFADGCTVASAVYEYTRCSCLCDSNNLCTTSIGFSGANNTTTYLIPDADIYIKFNIGGFPDRLIVEDDAGTTTYVDTFQMGTNTATGLYGIDISAGVTKQYQSFDLDPANADAWQTGIAVGDNIEDLLTATSITCNGINLLQASDTSAVTQNDATFFPTVLAGVTAIRGNDVGGEKVVLIKIPQAALVDTTLKITGIPSQDEMCQTPSTGHNNNLASYVVSCESFDPLLP